MTDGHRHGLWIVRGSRVAYQNRWVTLREDQVIRPDGEPGIFGVVIPEDNAAIVALDSEDRVVLVGEFLYPLGIDSWQIPSGGINAGESPIDAAKRELLEETGVVAESWISLGSVYLSGGISTQVSHVFLARDLVQMSARPEGTEQFKIRHLPLTEALEMADRSEIQDSPSLAGLYRAARLLAGA